MDERVYWKIANINREWDSNCVEQLSTLYRVMRTKEKVGPFYSGDSEKLFLDAMSIKCSRNYNGNARSFYDTFMILSGFGVRECFEYIDFLFKQNPRERSPSVPESLSKVLFNNVTDQVQTIFVPDCQKFGLSLYELMVKSNRAMFVTSCEDESLHELFEYLYQGLNVKFINGNIYQYNFIDYKFDLIFCFPVMGGREIFKDLDFISKEPALIAAQNLLYHLRPEGKLFIILPSKVAFGGGNIEYFRNYIQQNYKINEIDILPTKMFAPMMAINTYLFSFSIGKNEDIVLKKYGFSKISNSELLEEDEKLLLSDEFEALNGWNIEMAFIEEDEEVSAYKGASTKKVQLKEISSVFRGKAILEKAEGGNIGVINISNISETGIDYAHLDSINAEERKIDRYILKEGDVLVTSRGTIVKIAVFNEQPKPCVASSNINVIRTQKMLRGAFLKLFLESKVGTKILKSLQRGITIININSQDIEMLEVPVPPIEEQDTIIKEYETGLKQYLKSLEEANRAWVDIKTQIEKKLY